MGSIRWLRVWDSYALLLAYRGTGRERRGGRAVHIYRRAGVCVVVELGR